MLCVTRYERRQGIGFAFVHFPWLTNRGCSIHAAYPLIPFPASESHFRCARPRKWRCHRRPSSLCRELRGEAMTLRIHDVVSARASAWVRVSTQAVGRAAGREGDARQTFTGCDGGIGDSRDTPAFRRATEVDTLP